MDRMKPPNPLAMAAALLLLAGSSMHARSQATAAQPQLAILDTDIGDDIDDAFALALALRSPELKLLGVTTEFGDTALRARLVERYLAAAGRSDIPVAAGPATPQASVFTQAAYARQAPARYYGSAVDFLLDRIRAHPGQVTLIAIGPLVNVQAAIERDPATFRQLKRVVMMGGSIHRGYDHEGTGARTPAEIEWNARCSPAGLRALLASGVPVFMLPLDSTQIRLDQPELAAIFSHGSPLTDQLTLLYHEWSGAGPWQMPALYDPVAVAYAIRPELCPAKPMRIAVDEQGFTRPEEGTPNANVCLQADEPGFKAFLRSRLTDDAVR